ncbi:hypothetical protein LX32DRAFT_681758 [Colletotrichum zoysiae]|uniref:Uncharacterized protein n=1 Tax=Colletotrichum zoysiae TaxID=1216348 RepID=A0AAD9HKC4_9PEZI|nr:hypothetical protein LX32DRAFT_681758 [Colletotrichum zoysiae]
MFGGNSGLNEAILGPAPDLRQRSEVPATDILIQRHQRDSAQRKRRRSWATTMAAEQRAWAIEMIQKFRGEHHATYLGPRRDKMLDVFTASKTKDEDFAWDVLGLRHMKTHERQKLAQKHMHSIMRRLVTKLEHIKGTLTKKICRDVSAVSFTAYSLAIAERPDALAYAHPGMKEMVENDILKDKCTMEYSPVLAFNFPREANPLGQKIRQ